MISLYERYLQAKERLDDARRELEDLQIELYTQFESDLNRIGDTATLSLEDQGFKVKIQKKETVQVNHALAAIVGIGFRQKFELDKITYKKLSDDQKIRVDECIITKPAKPTFIVERIL